MYSYTIRKFSIFGSVEELTTLDLKFTTLYSNKEVTCLECSHFSSQLYNGPKYFEHWLKAVIITRQFGHIREFKFVLFNYLVI